MTSVLQCPKCGWIQVSEAAKKLKCRKCEKTTNMRKVKVIKVTRNKNEARALVIALREKLD